jgi:hypothetical protein
MLQAVAMDSYLDCPEDGGNIGVSFRERKRILGYGFGTPAGFAEGPVGRCARTSSEPDLASIRQSVWPPRRNPTRR